MLFFSFIITGLSMSFNWTHFFIVSGLFSLGLIATSWFITKRYLHFFQQEEYDNKRFLKWWIQSISFEKRANLFLIFTIIFLSIYNDSNINFSIYSTIINKYFLFTLAVLIVTVFLGRGNQEPKAKKGLVMTSRAKRIFFTSISLQVLFWIAFTLFVYLGIVLPLMTHVYDNYPNYVSTLEKDISSDSETLETGRHFFTILYNSLGASAPFIIILIVLIFIPFFLVLANLLLSPYESITQRRFLNEAKAILAKHKPKIIGITGSYGKTSIKHILSHILNSFAPTLATPGSVNTKMGITRIIREQLRSEHQYFIVEMGAYGIGSIRKLCDFTPPQVGIVTAVGLAHLERFRSVETVAQAKSELPRALPADGVAILNGDNLYCRDMASAISCPVYFYGSDTALGPLHCRLISDEIVEQGTRITFEYNGQTQSVIMPVYGKHQALNAVGAILASLKIGVPMLNVLAALQTLSQIPHRLVVQKGADGITTIDDAYNSNPDGFESALEVLKSLPGQRKILVTPGMVELGIRHDEEHRRIGKIAAASCDYVLLVASHRIQALKEGLLENGFPRENCLEFPTLQDARGWMGKELKAGDVVLFENDLPDLYEVQTAFRLF